jgi:hypothetical protein
MFAVVAVNVSTTRRGPAAYAFEAMNAATVASAPAAVKPKAKRRSLAHIVGRPQLGGRLLEALGAAR